MPRLQLIKKPAVPKTAIDWSQFPMPWDEIGPQAAQILRAVAIDEPVPTTPRWPQSENRSLGGIRGWQKRRAAFRAEAKQS